VEAAKAEAPAEVPGRDETGSIQKSIIDRNF
jgi:hypothetical protein